MRREIYHSNDQRSRTKKLSLFSRCVRNFASIVFFLYFFVYYFILIRDYGFNSIQTEFIEFKSNKAFQNIHSQACYFPKILRIFPNMSNLRLIGTCQNILAYIGSLADRDLWISKVILVSYLESASSLTLWSKNGFHFLFLINYRKFSSTSIQMSIRTNYLHR